MRGLHALILLLPLIFATKSHSQARVSGRILDAETRAPLAFVNIMGPNRKGTVSDVDGNFRLVLDTLPAILDISYLGYKNKKVPVGNTDAFLTIVLQPASFSISEVVVTPGENPAWRIIRKASENREKNDPEKNLAFRYRSYNKLFLTLDDTTVAAVATQDTSPNPFEKSYLFFSETYTKRSYASPGQDHEIVLGSKMSGFKNPAFGIIATESQSFSFYRDLISINGLKYLSPLVENSEKLYSFELVDTSYAGADTIFIISYTPRKNRNFDAIQGQLYINTDGYAVQYVTAEPLSLHNIVQVKIQQQYTRIDGKWFPEQLNTGYRIQFPQKGLKLVFVGEGKSYIHEVELFPKFTKEDFPVAHIDFQEGAGLRDSLFWNERRLLTLSEKEHNTYRIVDSIGTEANFDLLMKAGEYLAEGKIPWKFLSIPLSDIIRINDAEDFRLGIGAWTNKKVSRYFSIGAAAGYGFGDHRWKYRLGAEIYLVGDGVLTLAAHHKSDLTEPGSVHFPRTNILENRGLRELNVNRMDHVLISQVSLKYRMGRSLQFEPFFSWQTRTVSGYEYSFAVAVTEQPSLVQLHREFIVTRQGVSIRIAPGERFTRIFGKLVSSGSDKPIINLRYTYTDDGGRYKASFSSYDLQLDHVKPLKLLGILRYRINAGFVDRPAPYPFLYNMKANYAGAVNAASFGSFETMRFNEFMASRYIALHLRHDLRHLLFRSPKFNPGIFISGSMLWGEHHSNRDRGPGAAVPVKGYYEAGLEFTGLLTFQEIYSLGAGVFCRTGPYAFATFAQNIAFRINFTVNID